MPGLPGPLSTGWSVGMDRSLFVPGACCAGSVTCVHEQVQGSSQNLIFVIFRLLVHSHAVGFSTAKWGESSARVLGLLCADSCAPELEIRARVNVMNL